jgi:hypothetical protein
MGEGVVSRISAGDPSEYNRFCQGISGHPIGAMQSPDDFSTGEKAGQRGLPVFICPHTSHKEMSGRRNRKRFVFKIEMDPA